MNSNKICDLHIHLYGVLSAEDVWLLGKNTWRTKIKRLTWYEDEYQKAWLRTPLWKKYWTGEDGLKLLKKDYLFVKKANFKQFQACFNLIIALFPIDPNDESMLDFLFDKLAKLQCSYIEVRCPLSPFFSFDDIGVYLTNLARQAQKKFQQKNIEIKLIISLSRQQDKSLGQYRTMRSWLTDNRLLAGCVLGVDFDGFEESDEPSDKKTLISNILADNKKNHNKLGVTCHVGESFINISILTSLRRIYQLSSYGVHRLSNTISLGINPDMLKGKTVIEKASSRMKTLVWLRENFNVNSEIIKDKIDLLKKDRFSSTVELDDKEIFLVKLVQNITCSKLRENKIVIEVCPTSNMRIGMIDNYKNHPLHNFIKQDLDFCICSDDPGILVTDVHKEISFCQKQLGITANLIEAKLNRARDYSFASMTSLLN